MRRNRGTAIQLGLFVSALFSILYFNRTPSTTSPRFFAWSAIRYRTTASTLPPSRGICPGLTSTKKPALVVARTTSEDSTWLQRPALTDKYHLCIYTVDATPDTQSNDLQTPANRGHEAMVYLTFMIDNYANIPSAGAVFVHGSRFSWHNDHPTYDNLALLQDLDVPRALGDEGYHNLRCDWSTSMCPPDEAKPQSSFETKMRAVMEGNNVRAVSDVALAEALPSIFGGHDTTETVLGRTDAVRAQCCAQFVVGRANIHRHTRDEYLALRQWLLDGSDRDSSSSRSQRLQIQPPSSAPAPSSDLVAGRVLSYIWHILFLSPAKQPVDLNALNTLACPSAQDCYCRLYGKCDLTCQTLDSCAGQYFIPLGYRLPDDWEATYG